jgi:hypothetical protein
LNEIIIVILVDFFVEYGPSGGMPTHRYPGDIGLYSKGLHGVEGSWRGSSYSDIRSGFHRADPVYEEIEKPNHLSPRASVSDLSEDEGHLYPHDVDIYHRNIYGQQVSDSSIIDDKGRGSDNHELYFCIAAPRPAPLSPSPCS